MFKNISVKKAKIITAIMCILIGIISHLIQISFFDNIPFSAAFIWAIICVILIPMALYALFDSIIFVKK